MSAWPTDERITPTRRPRPRRWLLLALMSFVAFIAIPVMAPEFEEGQDPAAPWAAAFLAAFAGIVVGIVGAIVAKVRARRSPAEAAPIAISRGSDEEVRPPRGRGGLFLALGGLAAIVLTTTVWQAVTDPRPGDELGPIEGTLATIGVCLVIIGLAYWGMGKTQRAAERRMVRNLEGAGRVEPTPDEGAALQRAFADHLNRRLDSAWAVTAGNPTDVRQANLTLPIDPSTARSRSEAALEAFGAEVERTGDGLVRGSWFEGGALNGNPVVVTLAFAPDGLGGATATARSVARFYLTNQDLAQEALDRIIAALDERDLAPAPGTRGPGPVGR